MEVSPGVHLFRTGGGNVCLVTEPELMIFDSGPVGGGPALLAAIRSLCLDPGGLHTLCLTHSDRGHAGGAIWLREHTGARIAASPSAAAVLGGRASPGPLRAGRAWIGRRLGRGLSAFDVDLELNEGDEIGGFTVLETEGHTRGDLCYFRESDGLLIAGDAVRISGADILAPNFWTSHSEVSARIAISALAELPVRVLIPGHGPAYALPHEALRRAGGPPGFVEDLVRRRKEYRLARRKPKKNAPPGPKPDQRP